MKTIVRMESYMKIRQNTAVQYICASHRGLPVYRDTPNCVLGKHFVVRENSIHSQQLYYIFIYKNIFMPCSLSWKDIVHL